MSLEKTVIARLILIVSLALGASALMLGRAGADPGGPPGPEPTQAPPP
jgi:hypothetical protein